MRIFAYVVAVLSFATCIGCMISIPKFQAIYEDRNAELPILTQFVLAYDVLLLTLFLLLAVALIVLAAVNKRGIAAGLAGITLLLILVSGILVPVALMLPMRNIVQTLESSDTSTTAPDAP